MITNEYRTAYGKDVIVAYLQAGCRTLSCDSFVVDQVQSRHIYYQLLYNGGMHFDMRYRFQAVHLLWLSLFAVSFLLQVTGFSESWRYDRELIQQGHVWLLFSGHVVHLNWSHWLLNMAGLAIVAIFFSSYATLKQWLAVVIISAAVISAGLWMFMPEVHRYVGLSGILHGLFLYGAVLELRHYPLSGYVLLILLLSKLLWEFFFGALPGSEAMAGGHVLTQSHLLGAIGGILWLIVEFLISRFSSPGPDSDG